MSPAEVRLLHALGGTTVTVGWLRDTETRVPVTLVVSRGRLLRREGFKRHVPVGSAVLTFANKHGLAIALRGTTYEHDILTFMEQDEHLQSLGWRVCYVPTTLLGNSHEVRKTVLGLYA